MFAVHVSNPLTSSQRREDRDAAVLDTHRRERAERDLTRSEAWTSKARQDAAEREINGRPDDQAQSRHHGRNLAERAKYQFENDSEDDAMEDEIESNLDALHNVAGKLHQLAGAVGREVEAQNDQFGRIAQKTDRVDDQIAMNRARLDRIK